MSNEADSLQLSLFATHPSCGATFTVPICFRSALGIESQPTSPKISRVHRTGYINRPPTSSALTSTQLLSYLATIHSTHLLPPTHTASTPNLNSSKQLYKVQAQRQPSCRPLLLLPTLRPPRARRALRPTSRPCMTRRTRRRLSRRRSLWGLRTVSIQYADWLVR